jgi:hypothetical protein
VSSSDINDFANIIAITAVFPFGTVAVAMTLRWRAVTSSVLGIVMLGVFWSITLVLGFVIVRRIFKAFPGYEWVALGLYSCLTLAGVALAVIYFIERRSGSPALAIPISRKKRQKEES